MSYIYVSNVSLRKRFDAIRSLDPDQLIAEAERYKFSIKDLKLGGFVRLRGNVYYVTMCGRYDEWDEDYRNKMDYCSHEYRLLNLSNGEIVNLEWEEDSGEISVFASLAQLKFRDLRDDQGDDIDEDDLDQITEDGESLFYQGGEFYYEDDWAAKYLSQGKRKGEKAYIYEFESDGGKGITIEEWGEGEKSSDYEIWLTERINPDSIEIISTGD